MPVALASGSPPVATGRLLILKTSSARLEYLDIWDEFFATLIVKVNPHILTFKAGVEAPWELYRSIGYIVRYGISGEIVECGLWSGGSMLLPAHALLHFRRNVAVDLVA